MINAPPATATLMARNRRLTADQEETPGITAAHLVPGEELRMVLQELLQDCLCFIRCHRQGHQIHPLPDEDHIVRHHEPLPC